jgi:PEGA domain
MSQGSRVAAWAVLLCVVTSGAGARADTAPDRTEDQLIHEGVEARRRQDDAVALDLFVRAYALHHSPRAAAQMGLAEVALGRWIDAYAHLEEAVSATTDPWVQKNRKALDESLARVQQEVGMLEVLGGPPGAEVVIGGEVRGTLPLPSPIPVRAGELRFDLRAPGFQPDTRTVHVTPDQLTRETVRLARLAPVPSAPGTAPAEAMMVRERPSSDATPRAHDRGAGLRITGLVISGVGVAAVGAGLAFGLKARAAGRTDTNATTFNLEADNAGHRYQTLQWLGYGTGAALLAGGLTTYLIGTRRNSAESTGTSVAFVPTLGGGIAVFGGDL